MRVLKSAPKIAPCHSQQLNESCSDISSSSSLSSVGKKSTLINNKEEGKEGKEGRKGDEGEREEEEEEEEEESETSSLQLASQLQDNKKSLKTSSRQFISITLPLTNEQIDDDNDNYMEVEITGGMTGTSSESDDNIRSSMNFSFVAPDILINDEENNSSINYFFNSFSRHVTDATSREKLLHNINHFSEPIVESHLSYSINKNDNKVLAEIIRLLETGVNDSRHHNYRHIRSEMRKIIMTNRQLGEEKLEKARRIYAKHCEVALGDIFDQMNAICGEKIHLKIRNNERALNHKKSKLYIFLTFIVTFFVHFQKIHSQSQLRQQHSLC
jgi:hypothetical protein